MAKGKGHIGKGHIRGRDMDMHPKLNICMKGTRKHVANPRFRVCIGIMIGLQLQVRGGVVSNLQNNSESCAVVNK